MKSYSDTETKTGSKASANHLASQTSPLQAKMKVGAPDDKYEQEADQVAERVMTMPATNNVSRKSESYEEKDEIRRQPIFNSISLLVQRQTEEEEESIQTKPFLQKNTEKEEEPIQAKLFIQRQPEEEEPIQAKQVRNETHSSVADSSFESNVNAKRGSGNPLPESTRSFMEKRIGADFSGVRVHHDSVSAGLSSHIQAQAFTTGKDIFFNKGKYSPESSSGKHLLAHELTHVVQQNQGIHKKEVPQIQRGWLGDAWDSATGAISDVASTIGGAVSDAAGWIGDKVSGAVSGVTSGVRAVWNKATTFLGNAASSILRGLSSLGNNVLKWLAGASSYVWNAIKWFGNKAWQGIKILGTYLWEKLSMLGSNVWSFITNIPIRLWRLVVHGWNGIIGVLGWIWYGLSGAAGHLWQGIVGVFNWLGKGVMGAANWIMNGIIAGSKWAIDFISAPSLSKLWDALVGSLSWIWSGLKGFAQWGWNGIVGAALWAWKGIRGFASWIWDAIIGGLEWAGRLLLYVLDLVGLMEGLQILWGLIFRMRKLTKAEINASLEVHPAGMIPYNLVRVDEGSLVAYISGYFSGGGYRAVTTGHVLHVAPGESKAIIVHELSHVAQYEHVGSVYMAEAIHAQAFGEGYNYINADGTFKHKHFNEFNREQQAQICEDYYKSLNGLGGAASASALQPFIDEMRLGKF